MAVFEWSKRKYFCIKWSSPVIGPKFTSTWLSKFCQRSGWENGKLLALRSPMKFFIAQNKYFVCKLVCILSRRSLVQTKIFFYLYSGSNLIKQNLWHIVISLLLSSEIQLMKVKVIYYPVCLHTLKQICYGWVNITESILKLIALFVTNR